MPSPEGRALSELILSRGIHAKEDSIREGRVGLNVRAVARASTTPQLLKDFTGRRVVLALENQVSTIAALIQLDGVASRIVLLPGGGTHSEIEVAVKDARADVVVTRWPQSSTAGQSLPAKNRWKRPGGSDWAATEWILLTSGTTGQPKMVLHTFSSLAGHIQRAASQPGDAPVWFTFYDIRRYGGLQVLLRSLIRGGSLVLRDPVASMETVLQAAGDAGATHLVGTPSHWRLALMANARKYLAPKYIRLSGEVADQGILDQLTTAFPDAELVHAFASTEAGLAFEVADRRAGFPADLVGCAGGAAQLRIVDGVLEIRSARCADYMLKGECLRIANGSGFVETGDAVVLQSDRYHFVGRRDGVVNVGGQKVHPEEVEAVINAHPDVQMSSVTARRNAITGAIVTAEIVPAAMTAHGRAFNSTVELEKDVKDFCFSRLPRHKVPVFVRVVSKLNVADTGKLVRLRA